MAAMSWRLPTRSSLMSIICSSNRSGLTFASCGSPWSRCCAGMAWRTEASRNRCQLGQAQGQPLDAMTREVDLGACIIGHAFERLHRAFAKLGVKDLHADPQ